MKCQKMNKHPFTHCFKPFMIAFLWQLGMCHAWCYVSHMDYLI